MTSSASSPVTSSVTPLKPTPNLANLALKLVQIPSNSGEEQNAMLFIENLATEYGFVSKRIPVDSNRWNVLISQENKLETLLTTHMDTVPGGPDPRIENGILWGRGACDAKGIAASMFCALCDLKNANVNNVGLLLVVGEETSSDGAKAAAKFLQPVRKFINGEPTELKFVSAQRGVLKFALKGTGKCAHSGYPELGHSAVHTLLDVLQNIRNEKWPKDHRVGETLVNVGTIQGGIAANVTAPSAEAVIMMRIAGDAAETEKRIHEMLPSNVKLEIHSTSNPQFLEVPNGETGIAVGYGSDVPHLKSLGTPLMYGPGSIHTAHTDHEHVLCADLETARKKYVELCMKEAQP